jgi:CheY-like chemotaxis protein
VSLKRQLLLVEDNPDDQFMVKRALRDIPDLEIKIAANGREAVDFLFAHELTPPYLVLLDLKMPRMGGNEALCLIREKEALATLPIVIFTSSVEPSDIEEAMSCKATEYVQKPVDFDRYNGTVRGLVHRYMGM